ncbi:unnamed protein product, partial [Rotaria magnacalcarata]
MSSIGLGIGIITLIDSNNDRKVVPSIIANFGSTTTLASE